MRLAVAVAALILLRLLVALAPAEPALFGVPFGLALELTVTGLSTLGLWFAVRTLLPEAGPRGGGSGPGNREAAD
jgi:hypothetical protein